jgi:hypothetical protein
MHGRISVAGVLVIAAISVLVLLGALMYMGSQVSARLGGPCSFPEQGPLPSFCAR